MIIKAERPTAGRQHLSIAVYGASKSGKTWFVGTFPRPAIVCLTDERGTAELHSHPNAKNISLFNLPLADAGPGVKIWDQLDEVLRYIAPRAGKEFDTLALDTTTLYAETVLNEITNYGKDKVDGRIVYGRLANIMAETRHRMQQLPLHVVWTFHVDDPVPGVTNVRRPLVPGKKSLPTFLPTCSIVGFIEKTEEMEKDETGELKQVTVHRLWTKCPPDAFPPFEVGTRFDHKLPEGQYKPDFGVLAKRVFGDQL